MLRILIAAALLCATSAAAETTAMLEVLRKTEVTQEDGTKNIRYAPVSAAVPGETLTYRITLENSDTQPATDVGMNLPVNANLTIDPFSISGPEGLEARFSVDGEAFLRFSELEVEEDGEARPAEARDITHMKIGLSEIPAETSVSVEYDATLE